MKKRRPILSLAILASLALTCHGLQAQELAPVVDKMDSADWLKSIQPTPQSSTSDLGSHAGKGCAGKGCAGGSCSGGSCSGGDSQTSIPGLVTDMGGSSEYAPSFAPSNSPSKGCFSGTCDIGNRIVKSPMATSSGTVAGYEPVARRRPTGCLGIGGNACGCSMCVERSRPRYDIWGGGILLRPRNAEVAYAVPIDGPISPQLGNGVQNGRTGVIDPDHETGFRFGVSISKGNCVGLMSQWTRLQTHTTDVIKAAAPDVLRSLVTHPLGDNAASDGLTSTARLDIDFDQVDLAFRMPWRRRCDWCAEFLWGVRYGYLNQEFSSTLDFNGQTKVETDTDFHGVGPRLGLLAQRRIGDRGVYAYSQGDASFLFGNFSADYTQDNTFSGRVVETGWESGRVVPQLDYELGVGVTTFGGRLRTQIGYRVSAWYNSVRTNEFISSVRTNDYDDLGDVISFDGLSFRTELRF